VAYVGIFSGIVNLAAGSAFSVFVNSIIGILWLIALVGCYVLLPFHPLKRGLHDLIAGSVVVYRDRFDASALAILNDSAKARRAIAIVSCVSAIVIAGGIWGFVSISKNLPMASLLRIQSKLESSGVFHGTSVMENTVSFGSGTTRSIFVQASVAGPLGREREDLRPEYDLAFQAIRDEIKDLSKYNFLRVGLRMGYNLGIRKRYLTLFQDENPIKPGERKDGGSKTDY
jgi:hypothetical protein